MAEEMFSLPNLKERNWQDKRVNLRSASLLIKQPSDLLSPVLKVTWILTWSNTNQTSQPKKMVKFQACEEFVAPGGLEVECRFTK